MNLFVSSIITPATSLPVTVAAAQESLAAAVTEEVERVVLWRAVVRQTRYILIDGPLHSRLDLEPAAAILSLTRWTPDNAAEVVDAASYSVVTRESGTIIAPSPGSSWPTPFRMHGSFSLNYLAGWEVSATENHVPASVQFMISKAISFRSGSGLGGLSIGSLKMEVDDSYATDALPKAITNIARGWFYRPGLFVGRP